MLPERMDDGALRRLMRQGRKAGGRDTEGTVRHPVTGTPQGGTGSPVRAKVCLPSVLDGWGGKVVTRHGRGAACLLRYADECVGACADRAEAARFDTGLGPRGGQCGLALSGATTRLRPCSRPRRAGHTRCACLGWALRWGQERQGHEHRKRRSARTQRRTSLQRVPAWGQEHRHLRRPGRCQRRHAQRRGYDHSDGGPGHAASLQACCNQARRMVLQWRKRRSPPHRDTWPGSPAVLERCKGARPRLVGRPQTRPAALTAYADVRKRVLLQSPVRENRPPGSVRGPLGNRRSYRDDANGLPEKTSRQWRRQGIQSS